MELRYIPIDQLNQILASIWDLNLMIIQYYVFLS
jgi:hypothetical protein